MALAGCGEQKTTTTVDNPDGTKTTTVVEKKLFDQKTTVTTTGGNAEDEQSSGGIKINIGEGRDGVNKLEVRGKGIRIDGAENDPNVDVNLPFVKVKKDGGKVHVKAPFVDIDATQN
jgi:hypothetical protein